MAVRRLMRRRWLGGVPLLGLALMGMAVTGAMGLVLRDGSLSDALLSPAPVAVSATSVPQRSFPVCAGGKRVTCVVDGDTFWLDGVKVRIADIDTPEVSQPGCAAESALGAQATVRLAQLLVAGPFEMAVADRDEDRYGRKLRIVTRDGRSLGEVLVQEGLAHRWGGSRGGWC